MSRTIYFIVESVELDNPSGKWRLKPMQNLHTIPPGNKWVGTYTTLEDAQAKVAKIKASDTAVGALIIQWSSASNLPLRTGDIAIRNCASGARIDQIISLEQRPYTERRYSGYDGNWNEVEIGEWESVPVNISNLSLTSGEWILVTPRR